MLESAGWRSAASHEQIQAATRRPQKCHRYCLPVQVSDHSQEWLCHLRQIGDFREGKDHEPYQKSFNRISRELNP